MPKQTFLHLQQDKQDTLIQAAKKEFSRVPLHDASIANIIKDAGIPRGSFYQYFEGKEDLYYYLLNEISHRHNDRFLALLKDNDGDIFQTFIDSFQALVQKYRKQEDKDFLKNTFLNMNYKIEEILAKNIYQENRKSEYVEIIRLIHFKYLNLRDGEDVHPILEILMAVTFQNLVRLSVKDLPEEEAIEGYVKQIELIKRGLYSEEKRIK